MQCNNCGMQLAEGEITCSRCGTPVNGVGQPYTATKTVTQQQIPMGQVQQPFVQQPVQQMPQQEDNKKSGSGRKFLIVLIVLALISLLSIMFYSVVLNGESKENEASSNKETTPIKEENKEDYGGYTFTIPEGYQYKLSDIYGLIIYNEKEAYSIAVDYTNLYETRKTTYMTHFPDQAATLVANVANREYLALVVTVPNIGYATQYATIKTEKASFIGLVAKSDYTTPGVEEFTRLTAILDSAEQKEEVSPGTTNDAGTAGIQVYTVDFNEFFTSTQETQPVQPTQ